MAIDKDLLRVHVADAFARNIDHIVNEAEEDDEDMDDTESDDDDDSDDDSEESDEEDERVTESVTSKMMVKAMRGKDTVDLGSVDNIKTLQNLAASGNYDSFMATDSAGNIKTFTVSNRKLVLV